MYMRVCMTIEKWSCTRNAVHQYWKDRARDCLALLLFLPVSVHIHIFRMHCNYRIPKGFVFNAAYTADGRNGRSWMRHREIRLMRIKYAAAVWCTRCREKGRERAAMCAREETREHSARAIVEWKPMNLSTVIHAATPEIQSEIHRIAITPLLYCEHSGIAVRTNRITDRCAIIIVPKKTCLAIAAFPLIFSFRYLSFLYRTTFRTAQEI